MSAAEPRDVGRIVSVAAPLYLSMLAVSLGALVNTDGLVRVVRDGTWLAIVVGALGAAAVAGVGLLAGASGVPHATVAALGAFPSLMAATVLLGSVGAMAASALIGLGRSRTAVRAGLLGAACTAGLSPVLVVGPGPLPALGLTGSGVALVLSAAATCAVTLRGLRAALRVRAVALLRHRPRPRRVWKLAAVGLPMAGTVLVKFAVLGVIALAAARISATAAAAHGIAAALAGLTFSAAVAVGQAGVPLVGDRAAGADTPGVRRAVRAGLLVATATVGLLGALLVALRGTVVPFFGDDPAVSSILVGLLPVVALAVLGDGVQAVLGFGLTGLRRTVPSFLVFAVLYGLLALVALPVARAGDLPWLWGTVAVVNVLVAVGQGVAFTRISGRLRAPTPVSS